MILELKNVHKSYSQGDSLIQVLKGIYLQVEKGETISIIGKSGSGKSTLLSMIAGLDEADKGHINIDGKDISGMKEDEITEIRSRKMGIIFQQFHLLPHLTALENVELALEIHGKKESRQRAIEALEKVELGHRLNHFPSQLSGGEMQRVAMARAIVINPSILLADEPSGSLDDTTGNEVMDLIFDLAKSNDMALVLVTHNDELSKRCKKVLKLDAGTLVEV